MTHTWEQTVMIEDASINIAAYTKLVNVWAYVMAQHDWDAMRVIEEARKPFIYYVSSDVMDLVHDDALFRYCGHNTYTHAWEEKHAGIAA